jgi:hypothetical protein
MMKHLMDHTTTSMVMVQSQQQPYHHCGNMKPSRIVEKVVAAANDDGSSAILADVAAPYEARLVVAEAALGFTETVEMTAPPPPQE